MILVNTSVWVDHLRRGDPKLVDLLERANVVMHPFVVSEIACGSLSDRGAILELLQDLPDAVTAGTRLWTRDKRSSRVAEMLGCHYQDPAH